MSRVDRRILDLAESSANSSEYQIKWKGGLQDRFEKHDAGALSDDVRLHRDRSHRAVQLAIEPTSMKDNLKL